MSGNQRPRAASKSSSTRKSVSKAAKSKPKPPQGHVCSEPGCGRVLATAAGLASHRRQVHPPAAPPAGPELPTVAVERLLASVEIRPSMAVLAATIRQLAAALEECEPADKAKTSKELTARVNDLLSGSTNPEGPDWTEDDQV